MFSFNFVLIFTPSKQPPALNSHFCASMWWLLNTNTGLTVSHYLMGWCYYVGDFWNMYCCKCCVLFIIRNPSTAGIDYFTNPDWSQLGDMAVWSSAATQAMYSVGVGFGSHTVLASYNKFHNNLFRDGLILCVVNSVTSIFCASIVFAFLGHASLTMKMPITDMIDNGPGLIFISYIQGMSALPESALWAFLFFTMVFTLGLDSLFIMVWTIYSSLADVAPAFVNRRRNLVLIGLCALHFLLGLPLVTDGGIHIVVLMDSYASAFR